MMEAPVPPMDGAPAEAMADAVADIQAIDPDFDLASMEDPLLENLAETEVPLDTEATVQQTTAAGMAMGGQVTYITDIEKMSDKDYDALLKRNAIPKPWEGGRWEEKPKPQPEPLTEERYKKMTKQIDRSHGGGPDYVGPALAIGLVVFVLVVVGGLMGGG